MSSARHGIKSEQEAVLGSSHLCTRSSPPGTLSKPFSDPLCGRSGFPWRTGGPPREAVSCREYNCSLTHHLHNRIKVMIAPHLPLLPPSCRSCSRRIVIFHCGSLLCCFRTHDAQLSGWFVWTPTVQRRQERVKSPSRRLISISLYSLLLGLYQNHAPSPL